MVKNDTMREAAGLIGTRLALECARTIALAAGDADRLESLDRSIDEAQLGLAQLHVAYPGDILGQKHSLDGAEMLLLTLALMPHHQPRLLSRLARTLGDDEPSHHAKLWYALELLDVPAEQAAAATAALLAGTLFAQRLVKTRPEPPEDLEATLHPHLAVLELFGLGQ